MTLVPREIGLLVLGPVDADFVLGVGDKLLDLDGIVDEGLLLARVHLRHQWLIKVRHCLRKVVAIDSESIATFPH